VRRLAALLGAAAALSGCGGSSFDRNNVTAVARHYFAAIADGKSAEACSLLSTRAKRNLGRSVKAVEPNTYKPTALKCAQEVAALRTLLSPQARAAMRNVALGSPAVSGSRATIRAVTGSRTSEMRLVKASNGWVVDEVAAQSPGLAKAGPATENQAALERRISKGEVKAATVDERVRTVQLTLKDGTRVLGAYDAHREPRLVAALEAKGVPVAVLAPAGGAGGG
jgi:hypothetical protein